MQLELLMFIQTLPPEHTLIPNAQYKSYMNEKMVIREEGGIRMSSQENHAILLYNIVFIKTALSVLIQHSLLWRLIMSKLIALAVILQD